MKEYYGVRDLHPLDYPIKSYEEQMTECKGMYDCVPTQSLQTKEHFKDNRFVMPFSPERSTLSWWNMSLFFMFVTFILMIFKIADQGKF